MEKNEPMALISNQLPCRKPHWVLPSRAIAQAFSANLAVSGQYTRLFIGVLHGISSFSPTNSSISVTHSRLKIRGSFSDGPGGGGGLSRLFCPGVSRQNAAGNPPTLPMPIQPWWTVVRLVLRFPAWPGLPLRSLTRRGGDRHLLPVRITGHR